MIKILMISPTLPPQPCGVGDYTGRLISLLDKQDNVEIKTISSQENADYVINHWNFQVVGKIKTIATELKPDVIHYQFPANLGVSSLFNLWLPRALNQFTTIVTIHEFEKYYSLASQIRTTLMARAFKQVVVTTDYQQQLLAEKKINSSVIPIAHPFEDRVLQSNFNHKDEPMVIGFFGFVQPHKKVDRLVSAVNKARGLKPSLKLTIIGNYDPHDQYHQTVRQKLGQNDEWLTGLSLPEVTQAMAKCDIMALPFKHGASTKNSTLLAALAVGLPVITTKPLVPPLDNRYVSTFSNDYSQDLLGLLGNKNQRINLGRAGKSLIAKQFNWTHVLDSHLSLYKRQK